MTIVSRLLERRSVESPRYPLTSAQLVDWMEAGRSNPSGVSVTEQTALAMPAVWRAVNLIAGTCASLPLRTYRRSTQDPATVQLLNNPHPDLTPFELWEIAYAHGLLWGNAYLRKVRNSAAMITALDPIGPWAVKVARVKADEYTPDGKMFEITLADGSKEPATSSEILHIPGFGYDGVCGVSPIRLARTSIGLGLAAEEYGARLFGSGSLMTGILQTEQRLEQDRAEELKERWRRQVAGLSRAHDIAVLGSGAKFQSLTMPNSDAQFIESRRFQIAEVGRWFGLPGHMLGDTEKSTTWGTGIEHMSIGMVVYTLRPTWLARYEQRISREVTPPNVYAKYAVEGLLRGDSAARAAFYTQMRNVGAMSANDIRKLEDMAPIPDGDTYLQPLNMAPLGATEDDDANTPT